MAYVLRIVTSAADPMARNAVVEPMLMRDNRHVITKVARTELSGMFQPGLTVLKKLENGRPPSRAKDQVWRDTVATVEIHAEVILIMTSAARIEAAAWLLVTL